MRAEKGPPGLPGLEFADLARGKSDQGRDYVFMEYVPFTDTPAKGEERCVLNDRYKLILSTQRPPELYDLRTDPQEVNNRWADMKSTPLTRRLLAQLQDWAENTHDPLTPKLIAAAKP